MTFLNWFNGKYSYDMDSKGSESISSAEQWYEYLQNGGDLFSFIWAVLRVLCHSKMISWFHALNFLFYHLICCNIFTTLGSHNIWTCLYNIPQHAVFGLCPSSSVYKYKNLNCGIVGTGTFSNVCWKGRTVPQAWQI